MFCSVVGSPGSIIGDWRQQLGMSACNSGRRKSRSRSREATPPDEDDIVVDLTQSDSEPYDES